MKIHILSSNGSRFINSNMKTVIEVLEGLEKDESILITSRKSAKKTYDDLEQICEYVEKDLP